MCQSVREQEITECIASIGGISGRDVEYYHS